MAVARRSFGRLRREPRRLAEVVETDIKLAAHLYLHRIRCRVERDPDPYSDRRWRRSREVSYRRATKRRY
jgi:hypothetical protein